MTAATQLGAAKERPIIFSGPMVRPILDGRKTQTRRLINPQPPTTEQFPYSDFGLSRAVADGVKMYSQNDYARLPKHPTDWDLVGSVGVARDAGFPMRYRCRYGRAGDRLWVRETYVYRSKHDRYYYRADHLKYDPYAHDGWRSSMFMPRRASRILLEVTEVRVERLQDISEEDARAEGVEGWETHWWTGYDESTDGYPAVALNPGDAPPEWMKEARLRVEKVSAREVFQRLWDQINGKKSPWSSNPWVWVVGFRRVLGPGDGR